MQDMINKRRHANEHIRFDLLISRRFPSVPITLPPPVLAVNTPNAVPP